MYVTEWVYAVERPRPPANCVERPTLAFCLFTFFLFCFNEIVTRITLNVGSKKSTSAPRIFVVFYAGKAYKKKSLILLLSFD